MVALILGWGVIGGSQASAGTDFYINVHNEGSLPVKLLGGDNNCWYIGDLAGSAAPAIPAGQSKLIHSETKASGSCLSQASWQNLDISFGQGGSYPDAYHGNVGITDSVAGNIDDNGSWDLLQLQKMYKMRGVPRGWLPVNPRIVGAQSDKNRGIFCLSGKRSTGSSFDLWVKTGDVCKNATNSQFSHLPRGSVAKAGRAKAGPDKLGGNADLIYNLFDTARTACVTTRPLQYWGYEQCDSVTNGNWNLDNVTTDIKEVKADGDAQIVGGWQRVASQTFTNKTGGQGEQSWDYKFLRGEETETETHRGWKVGGKLSFEREWEMPVFGKTKVGFDVEVEGDWGSTDSVRKNTEKEVTQGAKIEVPEGKTVRMVVKQQQQTLATNFTADLTAGKAGLAQPIKTPAARPLGVSAARSQTCIGYLGAGLGNSIRGLANYAYSQGMTPEDPNLSSDQKYFLLAGPAFSADPAKSAVCPGFPDGFPAAFAFNGTASYKANAGGPTDSKGKFAPDLPDIQVCAYESGGDHPHAMDAGDDDPCAVGGPPSADDYGTIVNGAEIDGDAPVKGDPDGSLIQAGGDNRSPNGALREYQGLMGDDLLAGTTAADLLRGGNGEDIVEGSRGPDQLHGEGGDDVIKGGEGDDQLHDYQGHNWLQGRKGNDRLYSQKGATGGLFGQKGNDKLTMKGRGGVTLYGGIGDDTYRLRNGARSRGVVEFPGGGFDKVRTDGNGRLTANVEKIVAVGKKGLKLSGNEGDNWVIGGSGRDTLAGGRGSDLLRGKAGSDKLVLQPFGLDLAIGGAGADLFEIRGTGPLGTVTARRKRIGARSAHLIKDLRVKQGDRIVLRRRDFNRGLRKARHGRVTYGQKARGKRPQFIFSKRFHLLSYDSDGTRSTPPVVIARIAKAKRIPLRAIQLK